MSLRFRFLRNTRASWIPRPSNDITRPSIELRPWASTKTLIDKSTIKIDARQLILIKHSPLTRLQHCVPIIITRHTTCKEKNGRSGGNGQSSYANSYPLELNAKGKSYLTRSLEQDRFVIEIVPVR